MDIIVGNLAGFCLGVKNAVEKTKEILKQEKDQIYCLGELVHNKQVIEELEKSGLKVINSIEEISNPKGKKVIIRAHGITKGIYENLEKLGIQIIDLTCPKVLAIHKIVKKYIEQDYFIIYIGDEKHPESIGTLSYADTNFAIIEKEEDVKNVMEKIEKEKINKALVIAQTTFNLDKFNKITQKLKQMLEKKLDLIIKNTICDATRLRQEETERISKSVDCMIIIGGKNSSNTKKLYEISCRNCNTVYHIETKEELKRLGNYEKIGIMAGASTPKERVEEIRESIIYAQ